MDMDDFDKSFRRTQIFIKVWIGLVFVAVVGSFFFYAVVINKAATAASDPHAAEQLGKSIGSFAAQFQKGLDEGKKAP